MKGGMGYWASNKGHDNCLLEVFEISSENLRCEVIREQTRGGKWMDMDWIKNGWVVIDSFIHL